MKNELLEKAWAAHGGLDRWNSFDKVHATIVTGGQLFDMKQTPQDSAPREMTVATKYEWASVTPFGSNRTFTSGPIFSFADTTTMSRRREVSLRRNMFLTTLPWRASHFLPGEGRI
jgi:hypothetical protein